MKLLALVLALAAAPACALFTPGSPLAGVPVTRVSRSGAPADEEPIELGSALSADGPALCVFGTYAADFNAIEYCQKLKHYWPKLRDERGIASCALVLNASPQACAALAETLDLPPDVDLLADPRGAAGKAFGVGRGWLPETDSFELSENNIPISPYVKLLGMLIGKRTRIAIVFE